MSGDFASELRDRIDGERHAIASEGKANGAPSKVDPFPIAIMRAAAIFAPLPPMRWAVEALALAPGASVMVEAYGYSGKSMVMQQLLLAKAAGARIWGVYSVPKGKVLHIDLEQGERLTRDRYQRLAKGHGIAPHDLADTLHVSVRPDVTLDMSGRKARDVWARIVEGYEIVLIDSLSAATPRTDENDRQIRRCIDMLDAVSEKTGCVPIVIHHGGKTKEGADRDARQAPRGHSAIFDAFSTVFHLEAKKGEPTRVTQTKDRWRGQPIQEFGLKIEDVAYGGDPRWGVKVTHLDHEQLLEDEDDALPAIDRVRSAVLLLVRGNPELRSRNGIAERIAGRRGTKLQAIQELIDEGKITQPGGEGSPFRVVD